MASVLLFYTCFLSVIAGLLGQSTLYGSSYGSGVGYGGSYSSSSASNDQCNRQCPSDYRPVCGSNGKTYGNSCQLRCDQAFTLTLVLQYEGACIGGSASNNYGSISGPTSPGLNFGGMYGSNNMGMQGISSQQCQWQCPSDFNSSPYGATSQSFNPYGTYPNTNNNNFGNSMYGQGAQMFGQVCDNRGMTYPSDCVFYRSMCDSEKRGVYLIKSVCPIGSGNSYYNSYGNNNYRRGLLVDSATTDKPASG